MFFSPCELGVAQVAQSARQSALRARAFALCGAAFVGLGITFFTGTTTAQTPAPPIAPAVVSPIVALDWRDLTPRQREALHPLEAAWPQLRAGQKRKWIAIVQNYPQLAEPERSKLHSRMAQWAALKPHQRETARLNFAAAKKLPAQERAANWEAYQALSPEDKKVLAKKSRPLVNTTALAPKPAASSVITPVPLTRRSSPAQREKVAQRQAIDPQTLLPVTPTR